MDLLTYEFKNSSFKQLLQVAIEIESEMGIVPIITHNQQHILYTAEDAQRLTQGKLNTEEYIFRNKV